MGDRRAARTDLLQVHVHGGADQLLYVYLIHKFGVTIGQSQILLFVFLAATAFGTMLGGPAGDRFGRKYVIWASILGTAPFSLAMPHVDSLVATVVLSFCAGLMLSSAFPAILVYAQELLPYQLGLVSGLFFGFAFGVAGIRGGGSRRSGRQSRNRFHLQPVRLYAADRAGGVVPSQSEKIGPGVRSTDMRPETVRPASLP